MDAALADGRGACPSASALRAPATPSPGLRPGPAARPGDGIDYRRSAGDGPFWELKTCRAALHARKPHAHREWSLGLVEGGRCTVRCAGRVQVIEAPALVWFAPGAVHGCEPARTAEWAFRMLYWNQAAPADGSAAWNWRRPGPGDQRLLAELWSRLEAGDGLALPADLAGELELSPAPPAPRRRPSQADGSQLSRPDRRFKRLHGLTPGQFRLLGQLQTAQELLRRGHSPLEAALAAGFYDQSHFTRLFKRLTGTSPGRYRQTRPAAD
jgi:hypothetical protein